jgi:hypothetical protein
MYKYSLDKTSKKFNCPDCEKKTFVKYFDHHTNEYLDFDVGRCDRESNCGYHKYPEKNNPFQQQPLKVVINKPKSILHPNQVAIHGRNFKNNNFIQFLKKYFKDDEIKSVILKYFIGTSSFWNGATVFWQINNKEEVVAGKIMLYDTQNGKRVKTPSNHINWIHKTEKIKDFELQQCFFGLHLINEFPNTTIALVESEKTALIMSLFLPDYLWLATGSKANLKKELVAAIKKFDIIIFPDKSEFEDWNKKVLELKLDGFNIKCSNLLENKEAEKGSDLADFFIQSRYSDEAAKTKISYTNAENQINNLAQINPEILNLIKTFDLVDENYNCIININ